MGVRRLVGPYSWKLKRQDICVVTHKVYSDPLRAEGGSHLIGFPKPCLHGHRALILGPQEDVGITVLAGRELVDLFGGTPYLGTIFLG
jgi:hypothetical protein